MSRYPQPEGAIPAAWRTVGGLIEAGVEVRAICHVCARGKPADLAAIAAHRGPDFSLYNVRAACQTPDCWGWVVFTVREGMVTHHLSTEAKRHYWLWDAPDRWRPRGQ